VKTNQEHWIKFYLKLNLLTIARSTIQRVCHHLQLSIKKVSHHLLDLAKLSIGKKFSSAVSAIAEQILGV